MKRKHYLPVLLSVCLLATSLSFTACSDSDLKKAAQASDDMARGISVALDLDAALIEQKLLSSGEALTVTSALLDLNRLVRQFNDTAQTYKSFDISARTALGKILADITTTLDKLNNQGVLKIKNPDAQLKFRSALAVMSSAVNVLAALLIRNH
ncbi:MAG: hypothetical protein HY231_23980 [Acidobacteria bacterium]|nr:hypothetical protein [Acidobacteriota bacterium]